MKTMSMGIGTALVLAGFAASAAEGSFESELLSIQHEWAAANYQASGKSARRAAFEAVMDHCTEFAGAFPDRVEALAWEGIVLSTYAGEVGAMGAMKYAKAAREALLKAEEMDPTALAGGIYASLGALYSKVPGGFIGFGDDDLAATYFEKALAVDPGNIDSNYFYGEFLIDQGDYAQALPVLRRALAAPENPDRPVFDAGRREEIRSLIAAAERELS